MLMIENLISLTLVIAFFGGFILIFIGCLLRRSYSRISKGFYASGIIYNLFLGFILFNQWYTHRDYRTKVAEAERTVEIRQNIYKEPTLIPITILGDIIKDPKSFDKKVVRVRGELTVEFEKQILSWDFCAPSVELVNVPPLGIPKVDHHKVALWVELDQKMLNSPHPAGFVEVTGLIDSNNKGHMGAWPGTIRVNSVRKIPIPKRTWCPTLLDVVD